MIQNYLAILLFSLLSCQLRAMEVDNVHVDAPEPLPLYEIGIGVATAWLPDYPGSNQSRMQVLPIPYAVYRGEVLRSDRRGMARARFFRTDIYEVNLSASGGLPTNSAQNDAREGMPNLDWAAELGPRLVVRLYKFASGGHLKLGLPIRAVFSTDFTRVDGRGWVFAPELQFDEPDFPLQKWNTFFLLTSGFTDRRNMQYFYEVAPQFARATRPEYEARGGYFGSDATAGLTFPILNNRVQVIAFATASSYFGSANSTSPLMKTTFGSTEALAVIWTFDRSTANASVD